ncbi:LexA family transcriptional regulator [Citromicrobium phage vB_CbaS-RXM]|nr:LexA family transcriptional regulator [Citromicrobium phage vB_CbaS-RXM]
MSAKAKTATPASEADATNKITLPSTRVSLTNNVGERIKWARERKELTQKQLAESIGKSRASMVHYEQNKTVIPLDVIEDIANRLGVSPEYIAFGRAGITGVKNAEEEILVIDELTSKDGKLVTTGGWAIPTSMFEELHMPRTALKAVCVPTDEPKLELARGDRVVVDTHATVSKDGLYVVSTAFGVRVVRVSMGFSIGGAIKIISGTDSTEETIDPNDLELVGRVVGIFRRTF